MAPACAHDWDAAAIAASTPAACSAAAAAASHPVDATILAYEAAGIYPGLLWCQYSGQHHQQQLLPWQQQLQQQPGPAWEAAGCRVVAGLHPCNLAPLLLLLHRHQGRDFQVLVLVLLLCWLGLQLPCHTVGVTVPVTWFRT